MSGILTDLTSFIEEVITTLGYPGIAFIMALENVFPPIPSELVMPYAGFLAADGKFNIVLVLISGTIGSVAGAIILYYVGYFAEEPIIRAFVRRYGRWFMLSEADLDRTLAFFSKYGEAVVFFGRLIPIIRSLISIPAGMNRMPLSKFLFFTTLGASIWTSMLGIAGYLLGENWEDVMGVVEQYQKVTIVVIVIIAVIFGIRRFQMWRSGRLTAKPITGDAEIS